MSEPNMGWTPPYSPDEFNALVAEVDRQGGALLPDLCEGRVLKYAKPRSKNHDLAQTCHCGNESMAVVTYEPSDDEEKDRQMRERGAGFARVCLVCDLAGLWPRYQEAVYG